MSVTPPRRSSVPEDRGMPPEIVKWVEAPWQASSSWLGPGWVMLAVATHRRLLEIDPAYTISVIRQKLGWLDYKVLPSPEPPCSVAEQLWSITAEAREASLLVCESCGADGSLIHGPPARTRCNSCEAREQAGEGVWW